jgi:5'-methylthioadenosine phosphorylase
VLSKTAKGLGVKLHSGVTYACMEGPRFETAAEIKALKTLGCDMVGMTNVPECVLAREMEICYAAVGIATNWAAGISRVRLTHADVIKKMKGSLGNVQKLFLEAISQIPENRKCKCDCALDGAVVNV